jgi:NADH:ubiquinone reductase (non-electrogenic)
MNSAASISAVSLALLLICSLSTCISPVSAWGFTMNGMNGFRHGSSMNRISMSQSTFSLSSSTNDNDNDNNIGNDSAEQEEECDNIVILGGGFGGLNTALTLDSLPWPINSDADGVDAADGDHAADAVDNSSKSKKKQPKIILVDNKERFVFLPLLYELCVGDAELKEVAPTFKSLLQNSNNIDFLQRNIQGIDVDNNKVYLTKTISPSSSSPSSSKSTTTTTECIPYKSLVVATGASIDLSSINGATKYALPFYTIQDCYELRKQLSVLDIYIQKQMKRIQQNQDEDQNQDKKEISVVIVGGGYSGVELALNLKERLSIYNTSSPKNTKGKKNKNQNENSTTTTTSGIPIKITILHRGQEVLQYANEYNRLNGQQRLKDAGIEICTGQSVEEVLPPKSSGNDNNNDNEEASLKYKCQIVTNDSTIDTDLLLWTAGSMSKNEQRDVLNSKLPRDTNGRIVTNQYLKVQNPPNSNSNIYALGDCARTRQVPYGATAAVAMQQAPVVAWNVFASTRVQQIKDKEKEEQKKQGEGSGVVYYSGVSKEEEMKQYQQLPFDYLDLGSMMTLGGDDATISSPTTTFELDGSIASVARRLIYAVRMPTLQQALTAAISSTNKRLEKSSLKKVNKVIDWK